MAKITALVPFKGVKDGEVQATNFSPGDEVPGQLGVAMVAAGLAKGESEAKKKSGPVSKAKKAPKNKSA